MMGRSMVAWRQTLTAGVGDCGMGQPQKSVLAIRRFWCKPPARANPPRQGIDRWDTYGILAAMNRKPVLLIAGLAALLLAGCADTTNYLVGYEPDQNFLSFNHPFTDAAAADVRTRAA